MSIWLSLRDALFGPPTIDPSEIESLYSYYPRSRSRSRHREHGPSKRILELKDNKEPAVSKFTRDLNERIPAAVAIAAVPPSKPDSASRNGVVQVARRIARRRRRTDGVGLLRRVEPVEKLSKGGRRDIEVHLKSIEYVPQPGIEDGTIVVIDDVTTTGNSLKACRRILNQNGHDDVRLMAIAKTV